MGKRLLSGLLLCGLVYGPFPVRAAEKADKSEVEALRREVRELRETVTRLQRLLEEETAERRETPSPPPTPPAGPAAGMRGFLQALNPEIGAIADVVGNLSENGKDQEGNDRIRFREAEVVFGGFADPFARYDLAVVFSDEETPEIEEGFLTFFHLPLSSKFRIGKYRNKIGKASLSDLNALPFVNEPLVISEYFGEEGFVNTGAQITSLVPNPWDQFLEMTLEVIEGGNEQSFSGVRRFPSFVGHGRTFFNFSDFTNLEIGVSDVLGSQNPDRRGVLANIFGTDVTFRRKVTVTNDFKWTTELYHNSQSSLGDFLGLYTYPSYRFHPNWEAGLRFDYLQPLPFRENAREAEGDIFAIAPVITYHLSEFNRIRFQYQHTAGGRTDNAFFLQFRSQIGIDRHALQ